MIEFLNVTFVHLIIKVGAARKRKNLRLKQAKEEAQADIERFRAERERGFREYEQKHMGSRDDVATRIDAETRLKIEAMSKNVSSNKDKVIDDMLAKILSDIQPQLHKNLRL